MVDDQLRALERRFRESGSSDDEAAWLSERVRIGELATLRVALAAGFGYPAALHLLPHEREAEYDTWRGLLSEQFAGHHPADCFEDPVQLVGAVAKLGDAGLQRAACAAFAAHAAGFAAEPVRGEALKLLSLGERSLELGKPVQGFDETRLPKALDRAASDALSAGGNPTGTQDRADVFSTYTWQLGNRAREFVRIVRVPRLPGSKHDLIRLCAWTNAKGVVGGTNPDVLQALKLVFVPWLLGTQR